MAYIGIEKRGRGEGSGANTNLRVLDRLQVSVANPDEVEQAVETEMGQRVVGALPDQRLGPEGDAHPGKVEHGQVVGPVAHRNHLLHGDLFLSGNLPEQFSLSGSVDDAAADLA